MITINWWFTTELLNWRHMHTRPTYVRTSNDSGWGTARLWHIFRKAHLLSCGFSHRMGHRLVCIYRCETGIPDNNPLPTTYSRSPLIWWLTRCFRSRTRACIAVALTYLHACYFTHANRFVNGASYLASCWMRNRCMQRTDLFLSLHQCTAVLVATISYVISGTTHAIINATHYVSVACTHTYAIDICWIRVPPLKNCDRRC